SFFDPDPAASGDTASSDYSATIDWGDGSAVDTGTITGHSSSFSVSGTHTYTGTGPFTMKVTVTDSDTPTVTTQVSESVSPLAITTTSLPDGTYGSSYTGAQLAATGGTSPYTFAKDSGSLPPGLQINSDGTITGTPTSAGTFNFTAKATDSFTPTAAVARKDL